MDAPSSLRSSSTSYFANETSDEIRQSLLSKVEDYYNYLSTSGKLLLWRRVYKKYYNLNEVYKPQSSIRPDGVQGELSTIQINDFKNLLTHVGTIIAQEKLNFETRSTNTDAKSQAQTILARQILDYYLAEKDLQRVFFEARDVMLKFGEAYVETYWNHDLGEPVAVDPLTQRTIKQGDLDVRAFGPIDVIRDVSNASYLNQNWYVIRKFVNKWELAAEYPDKVEDIAALSWQFNPLQTIEQTIHVTPNSEDNVPVYTFYHKKTAAVPDGRLVVFCDSLTLEDSALPYQNYFPITRMCARDWGNFGHSVAFDLLSVLEASDRLHSTVLSNQLALGVQNIWAKPGSNMSVSELSGGLNLIESNEEPKPLMLVSTAPEIFNYIKILDSKAETLSGINSIVRGDPENGLQNNSGAAFALLSANAVQFSSDMTAAYTKAFEDVCTNCIKALQQFATSERVAVLAGKQNRGLAKQFSAQDIDRVQRVVCERADPISRTVAGRVQLADSLLQRNLIKDASQYIAVIETGRIDPLIEDQESELLLVRLENEMLKDGKAPQVVAIDDPHYHIKAHQSVLADPEARQDPAITQATLAHIQEHIRVWQSTDPQLLMLLGIQPPPPPQGPPPAGGPQGGHPPGPPPPHPSGPPQEAPKVQAPQGTAPAVAANMPQMPELPKGSPQAAHANYKP